MDTSSDINLTTKLTEQLSQFCMKSDYADVEFIIGNERLPAHRVILAARSEYFRTLLYETKQQQEVYLDVSIERFKIILKYVYTGHLILPPAVDNESDILEMLIIANQYKFEELVVALSQHIRKHFSLKNISTILDAAIIYEFQELTNCCLAFMDDNAKELLRHQTFLTFEPKMVELILRRDTFVASEISIFQAIKAWHERNPLEDLSQILACLRLELLTQDELMEVVRPTKLISPERLLIALGQKTQSPNNLPYRMWAERNLATAERKASIYLRNGTVALIDLLKNILYHDITDETNHGIVIRLAEKYAVNHIKLRLCDVDKRVYSYIVEVSPDNRVWQCVVDYSLAHNSSWQYLYFEKSLIRYIRLIGVETDHIDRRFIMLGLEVMCTLEDIPEMIGDVIVPRTNIALESLGALAFNENNIVQNDVLNPEINEKGYFDFSIRHTGVGYVLIRLGQPYFIGSMRILLWDRDDRTYRYFVETSLDKENWSVIVDKRQESSRGWQNLSFPPHAVIYVRIICTRMTSNDGIFRCVHFECPSVELEALKEKYKHKMNTSLMLETGD